MLFSLTANLSRKSKQANKQKISLAIEEIPIVQNESKNTNTNMRADTKQTEAKNKNENDG